MIGRATALTRRMTAPWTRRQVLFSIGAGLTATLAAGCGGGAPSATPTARTAPTVMGVTSTPAAGVGPSPTLEPATTTVEPTMTVVASASATPSPEPRTVSWWTGLAATTWLTGANDAAALFTKANPNITVRVSGGHSDFGRVVGGIASGQVPDTLDVGGIVPFASRGLIASLETRLQGDPLTSALFYPAMLANGTWRGQTFGIPALDHGPELGLIWNKALTSGLTLGSDPNQTLADLFRVGRSLTTHDKTGAIETLGFDPLDGVGSLLDTARDLTGQNWIDETNRQITISNKTYESYLSDVVGYYRDLGMDQMAKFRQDVPSQTDSRESGENRGKQVALISGYWSVSDVSSLEQDPTWKFDATWAPNTQATGSTQRFGGRLLVIPTGARQPGDGWSLIQFLVSDDANAAMFDRTGRFASTRSFVGSNRWKSQPTLKFFLESIGTAVHLTSRATNPVASFAEVKWEQAVADILTGSRPVADALGIAQKAVDAEYRLVGG